LLDVEHFWIGKAIFKRPIMIPPAGELGSTRLLVIAA